MERQFEKRKLQLGLVYGLACGLAFVLFAWGIDALLLSRAHGTYAFLKLAAGAAVCVPVSGLVGRMTVEHENHFISLVLWALLALVFSWLVIWLPARGAKEIIGELSPGYSRLLHYGEIRNLWQYRMFVTIIVGLAAVICGLLEINLVEQALLNPYAASIVILVLAGALLFGIAGSACDYLFTSNFREPVLAVDDLLRYAREHQGEEIPPDIVRKKHLGSVRQISDILGRPYRLMLMEYDPFLGQMEVLVRFNEVLVQCTTIYSQPTNCIRLSENR